MTRKFYTVGLKGPENRSLQNTILVSVAYPHELFMYWPFHADDDFKDYTNPCIRTDTDEFFMDMDNVIKFAKRCLEQKQVDSIEKVKKRVLDFITTSKRENLHTVDIEYVYRAAVNEESE